MLGCHLQPEKEGVKVPGWAKKLPQAAAGDQRLAARLLELHCPFWPSSTPSPDLMAS